MTLIAFHAQHDRADIITDTWSYTPTISELGRTSKVALLPNIDAAVACQGMTTFGTQVDHLALDLTRRGTVDLDELNHLLPRQLHDLWDWLTDTQAQNNAATGADVPLRDSVAFTIGWSPAADRFVATAFASPEFDPVEITGPFVYPSPTTAKPSALELRHLDEYIAEQLAEEGLDDTAVDRLLAMWTDHPPIEAPATTEDWVALADRCRRERSMLPTHALKVLIGGALFQTVMTRGATRHAQVATFDDSPEILAQVLAGTLHPLAQAGPCGCNSGRSAVECCLPALAAKPCPCRSGKTFGDCCSIAVGRSDNADRNTPQGVSA